MERSIIKREELYELVWSETLSKLSVNFNVSYHQLKKICIQMNIPLPKSGYWVKLRYGKHVESTPLSSNYSGTNIATILPQELANKMSPLEKLTTEIQMSGALLVVLEKLSNPHHLILLAKKGLAKGDNAAWWNQGLIASGLGNLDIKCSKDLISRSLRIMDTNVKALEARGHEIHISGYATKVKVSEIELEISLREKRNRVKIKGSKWDQYEHVPSGLLIFQVGYGYNAKVFIDGRLPLEKQIAKIIAYVEIRAEQEIQYQIELEKGWEEHRLRREVEEKRREVILNEKEETKKLLSDAHQWNVSQDLRSYISAVEKNEKYSEEWVKWAKAKADWMDPLINVKDDILGEFEDYNMVR